MQNTEEREPTYEKIREINYETNGTVSGEKRRNLSFFIILLISFGFFATYFLFQNVDFDFNTQSYQPEEVGSEVHIELSKVSTKAQFFQYNSGGTSIKYFAVMGSDDSPHIAFDACDVCYQSKKGYSQNNDKMHCNNCGQEFAINSLGTENLEGGCWPSYLPATESNGKLIIIISDLESKKFMFE